MTNQPTKMIDVEISYDNMNAEKTFIIHKGSWVTIDPTQHALQDYINKAIKEKGYIKREDAINEVEIDVDKLKTLPIDGSGFVDCELGELILDIKHLNPLKLKQKEEDMENTIQQLGGKKKGLRQIDETVRKVVYVFKKQQKKYPNLGWYLFVYDKSAPIEATVIKVMNIIDEEQIRLNGKVRRTDVNGKITEYHIYRPMV